MGYSLRKKDEHGELRPVDAPEAVIESGTLRGMEDIVRAIDEDGDTQGQSNARLSQPRANFRNRRVASAGWGASGLAAGEPGLVDCARSLLMPMQISIVSYEKHRNSALEVAEQEYIKRLSRQAYRSRSVLKRQGARRPTGPAVERDVCRRSVRERRAVHF